jgi:hypothetical protein
MDKSAEGMHQPILQAQPAAIAGFSKYPTAASVVGVPVALPVLAAFENVPATIPAGAEWADALSPQVPTE